MKEGWYNKQKDDCGPNTVYIYIYSEPVVYIYIVSLLYIYI